MVRGNRSPGFTLIELLVVIAIIGVLMALLIPAVQHVRAAADKVLCGNNLRQIGIALHHYSLDHGALPPGGYYPSGITGSSWSIQTRILPYLEQDNLQKLADLNRPYSVQPVVTSTRVPLYICPSDAKVQARPDGAITHYPLIYLANMGTWMVFDPARGLGGDGVFPASSRSNRRGISVTSIYDGTSNTIGFSEGRAFTPYLRDGENPNGANVPPPSDPSFVRTLGGSFKPDSGHTEWVDARVHQTGFTGIFTPNTDVMYTFGGVEYHHVDFNTSREGRTTNIITYAAVTARSYHNGCVNCLLMDGSVRSVANEISLPLWRSYLTRSGADYVGEIE